jgi:hypothetical protein
LSEVSCCKVPYGLKAPGRVELYVYECATQSPLLELILAKPLLRLYKLLLKKGLFDVGASKRAPEQDISEEAE